jgi:hypothetical protein
MRNILHSELRVTVLCLMLTHVELYSKQMPTLQTVGQWRSAVLPYSLLLKA